MNDVKHSLAEIKQIVAEQLKLEPSDLQEDDNLFMLGLDSVSLMALVSQWRKTGLMIEFQELAEEPTLQAWFVRLNLNEY